MIGQSRSGKTAYMSGLHDGLFLKSVEDFRIAPSGDDKSSQRKEFIRFKENSFESRGFHFALGTTETAHWEFDLNYLNRKVESFQWIDYKGELIKDAFTSLSFEDVKKNSEME
jgi:hypothetical protein